MSSITQICLTDPGEGLTEAEIIEIKVKEGDRVEINDPVVTVETAKSAVELPSHVAGIVAKVHVKEGDELNVGGAGVGTGDSHRCCRRAHKRRRRRGHLRRFRKARGDRTEDPRGVWRA